jgi:hypothetical protein
MKNSNGLLYLIILLLIGNLCGTFWLISRTTTKAQPVTTSNETIDKNTIIKEFDKIVTVYNSGEKEAIWNMFSDYAKAQMDKENSIKAIVNLKDTFGNIEKGTYMYQEFSGKQGNLSFYKAYFTVELLDSKIGDKAILAITMSSDGTLNELVGFHLNTK